ncbi:MAG: FliO/MopB family protein [Alphaproteobacteria bacterium]
MDMDVYLRFVASLAFVLALIAVAGWAVRRYGFGAYSTRGGKVARRIAIVEQITLDTKRRLVLLRRDDVEHLVLLGTAGDLVIETAIPGDARAITAPGPTSPDRETADGQYRGHEPPGAAKPRDATERTPVIRDAPKIFDALKLVERIAHAAKLKAAGHARRA